MITTRAIDSRVRGLELRPHGWASGRGAEEVEGSTQVDLYRCALSKSWVEGRIWHGPASLLRVASRRVSSPTCGSGTDGQPRTGGCCRMTSHCLRRFKASFGSTGTARTPACCHSIRRHTTRGGARSISRSMPWTAGRRRRNCPRRPASGPRTSSPSTRV